MHNGQDFLGLPNLTIVQNPHVWWTIPHAHYAIHENHYIRVCRVQAIVPHFTIQHVPSYTISTIAAWQLYHSLYHLKKCRNFTFFSMNRILLGKIEEFFFAYWEILYFQIGILEINKLLHKHVLKLPLYSATSIPKRVLCNKYLKSHRTLNLQRGLKMDPFPVQNPAFNVENFQNFTVFKEQNFEKKIQFFWNILFFDMKSSNLIILGQLCVKVAPTLQLLQSSRESYVVGTLNFYKGL